MPAWFWAGLTTVAFGVLYQVSGWTLALDGIIGGGAWAVTHWMAMDPTQSLMGNFMGALLVGLAAELAARWRRQPVLLFVVPGIITFVPGYAAYQSMVAFVQGHFNAGLQTGIHAVLAAAALSIGLAAATAVMRPLLRARRTAAKL